MQPVIFHPGAGDLPYAFTLEIAAGDDDLVHLLLSPPASRREAQVLWSRSFECAEDRIAFLDGFHSELVDITFIGHLTMIFGADELDRIADETIAAVRAKRAAAAERTAKRARDHLEVQLFASDKKRGYLLELQRRSRDKPDWALRYDRASERDRMCDWLRWQKPRFLSFLEYASRHGDEALARLLTDEMFVTEARVKKEGRGAGGMRPLRMWRGD